jgi:carbonic anhydrase/acetyltransferase-like protein (isoleucine patch superfamily)
MIRALPGKTPRIHPDAYVDESAQVIGEVEIGEGSSVWPLALVRGDQNWVRIGRHTNVQDLCVCHVDPSYPLVIGDHVTLGHRAVVHGCTIRDHSRIGIGAIVLNGAVVEEGAQVGAGALVPPGKVVPAGWLVMGVPARPVRKMSGEELADIDRNAVEYYELWRQNWPPVTRGG